MKNWRTASGNKGWNVLERVGGKLDGELKEEAQ